MKLVSLENSLRLICTSHTKHTLLLPSLFLLLQKSPKQLPYSLLHSTPHPKGASNLIKRPPSLYVYNEEVKLYLMVRCVVRIIQDSKLQDNTNDSGVLAVSDPRLGMQFSSQGNGLRGMLEGVAKK